MLNNYFLLAFRNIRRSKGYSAVNIFGLSVGLACCILILLYVYSELQFDRFNKNADRIYRVLYLQADARRGQLEFASGMPPMAAALKEDLPEVEVATNFVRGWRLTVKRETSTQTGIISRNYYFSGPETFDVFTFPLLEGDPGQALKDPGSVVLTEEKARQLFGNEDPLGKRLFIDAEDFPEFRATQFTVTGVLRPIPSSSHLQFDFLISKSTLNRFALSRAWMGDWDNYLAYTYVLLHRPGEEQEVEAKLPAFTKKHVPEEKGYQKGFTLQPLTDIHFGSGSVRADQNANEGDIVYVRLFALIALFIVGIACVNYVNLATARAIKRMKEIGLRKVVGAARSQMISQFMLEAVTHSLLAGMLAIGLVQAALPSFNAIANTDLSLISSSSLPFVLGAFGLVLFVGLAAGLYPALYLSRLTPARILRGESASGRGGSTVRSSLVVVQFVVTVVMIVATIVVMEQLKYVRTAGLGFDQDHMAVVDINSDDIQENYTAVKQELLKSASISAVAVSSRVPGDWKSFRTVQVVRADEPGAKGLRVTFDGIDEDFLSTYGIPLAEGRNFNRAFASDSTAVLLNETAARALFGAKDPVGQRLRVPGDKFDGHVVGVVRDFHIHSLHDAIEPLILGFEPLNGHHVIHGIDYFTIRMAPGNVKETVDYITKVNASFDRINPIELGFLDQWWDNLYGRDARLGRVFAVAAGLAILIACVGLFGLAAFSAEQRTKEIGVRKVLGASVRGVVFLLSKDFARLVVVGLVLAVPIAWYAMNLWLAGFAYRIPLAWWMFAAGGGIAFLIAVATVSVQALRTALANPVEALRYE